MIAGEMSQAQTGGTVHAMLERTCSSHGMSARYATDTGLEVVCGIVQVVWVFCIRGCSLCLYDTYDLLGKICLLPANVVPIIAAHNTCGMRIDSKKPLSRVFT